MGAKFCYGWKGGTFLEVSALTTTLDGQIPSKVALGYKNILVFAQMLCHFRTLELQNALPVFRTPVLVVSGITWYRFTITGISQNFSLISNYHYR